MVNDENVKIRRLSDLNRLRSAPRLNAAQAQVLKAELELEMKRAKWFTIGIMASSIHTSIYSLRQLEATYGWSPMILVDQPEQDGPVYLKANQRTGEVRIRIEYGLGEGILISGHVDSDAETSVNIWGPLPLNMFNLKV